MFTREQGMASTYPPDTPAQPATDVSERAEPAQRAERETSGKGEASKAGVRAGNHRGPVLPVTGLTAKQEAFAQHVVKGASLIDAYRLAFNPPNSSLDTITTAASALYRKPDVQARTERLMEWTERAEHRAVTRSVERWWSAIWRETEGEDTTPASRVSALREIGKALGIGATADTRELTADEASQDLEQRL